MGYYDCFPSVDGPIHEARDRLARRARGETVEIPPLCKRFIDNGVIDVAGNPIPGGGLDAYGRVIDQDKVYAKRPR